MSFHVGQKVVCVNDRRVVLFLRPVHGLRRLLPRRWVRLDHNLNRGDVYKIIGRQVLTSHPDGTPFEMLHVAGARHFEAPEIGFPSFQFKPLIERKTNISIFTQLLAPSTTKVKEKEPAQ